MDLYNSEIYPQDSYAKQGIDINCSLKAFTGDDKYLDELAYGIRRVYEDSMSRWGQLPDIVIYNAGTDILEGDELGCLSVTPAGVCERKTTWSSMRAAMAHGGRWMSPA